MARRECGGKTDQADEQQPPLPKQQGPSKTRTERHNPRTPLRTFISNRSIKSRMDTSIKCK